MTAPIWSALGCLAALIWVAILHYSDRHPKSRLWPPHQGSLTTAAWAWGLTIMIYVGAIQAGFAAPNAWGLPGWLQWGVGGALTLLSTLPHTIGTLALGLKRTSGYPGALVTTGIYGWRRHPQYLGQILTLLSIVILAGTAWALWPALIGSLALVYAGRVEDRHLAATVQGHTDYVARTRAFL